MAASKIIAPNAAVAVLKMTLHGHQRCLFNIAAAGRLSAIIIVSLMVSAHAVAQQNAFGVPSVPADPQLGTPPLGGNPLQPAPDVIPPGPFGVPAQPAPNQPFPAQPFQGPQTPYSDPAQTPPLSIQDYLVSLWHGHFNDKSGAWDVFVSLRSDGSFVQQQMLNGGQFRLQTMGRYTAKIGANGGLLVFNTLQWEPRMMCTGPQGCQPINIKPSLSVRFNPIGRDMLRTENGVFQRIGPAS